MRNINLRIGVRWCATLILLATGNPLYAQVCRSPTGPTCEQKCGPLRDGNATEHANCLTDCEHTPVCPPEFGIQVQVTGLTGGLLRVGESGGPLLAITTNGQFSFPVKVPYGHAYAVSVLSEPPGDKCTLSSPHSGNAYSPILVKVTCVGPPLQVRMSWESFVSGPDGAKRLASLIAGITKMKSLDASPPNSADYRRSWQYWANIHGYYGSQSPDGTVAAHIQLLQANGLGADVSYYQGIADQNPPDSTAISIWATCQHSAGTIQALNFFGWHRMYLYYFEQVLRWAANDDTLRLPYWDYTNPADTALPAEFRNATSPLYDALRNSNLNAGTSTLNPSFTNIDQLLTQPDYFSFESSIEEGIHGYVHCTTGPTCPVAHMGDVPVAANDPIFYAHHANIDRIWACWQSSHAAPPGNWQSQTFEFVDATGSAQTRPVSDFLNSSSLGYVYDNAGNCSRATQPKPHRVEIPLHIVTANNNAQSTLLGAAENIRLLEAKTSVKISLARNKGLNLLSLDRRIQLVLRGVSAKSPPGALFAVYIAPAARPTVRQLAGTISWFGVFGHHGSQESEVRNLVFDVTEHLQQMGDLSKETDLVVTLEADSGLVPSGQEQKAALSAPASTSFKPEAEVRIAAIEVQQVPAASRSGR